MYTPCKVASRRVGGRRLATPADARMDVDATWKLVFDGVVLVILVVAFFVPPRAETETVFVHVADE